MFQIKFPIDEDREFYLVDTARENWNYIFAEVVRLNEKLEQLGINATMVLGDY